MHRAGPMQIQEVWEDGQASHLLTQKLQSIAQQKEEIEQCRKALRKKLAPPPSSRQQKQQQKLENSLEECDRESVRSGSSCSGGGGGGEFLSGSEFVTTDEIYKVGHRRGKCGAVV